MATFSPGYLLRRAGMPAMVAMAAAAVLLVAGCGGAPDVAKGPDPMAGHPGGSMTSTGSSSAAGAVLDVTGTEYAFGGASLKAAAGLTTIRFTNKGAMEHDFSIKTLGIHLSAAPGKSAEATVTLKPGTYKSTCTIPGHAQSGMQATLRLVSRHHTAATVAPPAEQRPAKESDVLRGSAKHRAIGPLVARIASGGAAVGLLLLAARLPIWQAKFSAPQYPEGLNIAAYGDTVKGDLNEINELSHYIGMPPFNFVGMPEMRLWPLVILVAIVAAVLAVVTRRRWLRRLACAAVWLIPVGALADVQFRLWQVGHSLDPLSAIRVSPFTPRVVGPTTLMNFTIQALPGMALVLIALAAALVTAAPLVARRLTP